VNPLVTVAALAAAVPAVLRWLRVAQREHYLPGSVSRFAWRWWAGTPLNAALGVAAVVSLAAAWVWLPAAGAVALVAVVVGPVGLPLRGRTSKLAWTRRLRTLTLATALVALGATLAGWAAGVGAHVAVTIAVVVPAVVDAVLLALLPVERRAAARYVEQATTALRRVDPVIVAITGSYGKTTTKGYVRHLLSGSVRVVASPASFNNTAGLSRAVNEGLAAGTEVFVAEMGTYGRGEIRGLCSWVQPEIAVITAIGPVHLERMGSIENIVAAKTEIVEGAEVAVLNVDAPYLADVAAGLADRMEVVRCSATSGAADVFVGREGDSLTVVVRGEKVASLKGTVHPTNVACALGIVVALEVPMAEVVPRLATLPGAPNRQQVSTSPRGVVVIDDTFNANPAGAVAALELLNRHTRGRRRVVVTPGMVELGSLQYGENASLAAAASRAATDVVVVGRTNRRALLEGARHGPATVHIVDTREEAVEWVRAHLGPGDGVLYENDLPDHYP
jgi:UDP-N-acetylmuramoyl-tripeptide--D-alanyl-D-alanine ligase